MNPNSCHCCSIRLSQCGDVITPHITLNSYLQSKSESTVVCSRMGNLGWLRVTQHFSDVITSHLGLTMQYKS